METPQTKHPLNKMFTCVCVCVNFRVFVECTCVTTGCKDVYALFAMWYKNDRKEMNDRKRYRSVA